MDKNLDLINHEIKELKHDKKACEALKEAVMMSFIASRVPQKGKGIVTVEHLEELNDALSLFVKYKLFENDKLFNEPSNPVSFISMAKKLSFDKDF